MKTIKVHVSTNRVGSGDYREFEVDDEAPLGEIEGLAREEMFDTVEWHCEYIDEGDK